VDCRGLVGAGMAKGRNLCPGLWRIVGRYAIEQCVKGRRLLTRLRCFALRAAHIYLLQRGEDERGRSEQHHHLQAAIRRADRYAASVGALANAIVAKINKQVLVKADNLRARAPRDAMKMMKKDRSTRQKMACRWRQMVCPGSSQRYLSPLARRRRYRTREAVVFVAGLPSAGGARAGGGAAMRVATACLS